MFCNKCGKEIESGMYCEKCKEKSKKTEGAGTKICKNCRERIPLNAIYCSYCHKFANVTVSSPSVVDEGSFWAGWWLGFLAGLVGLIIALVIGKSETTRGAKWGFAISIILSVALGLFYGCVVVVAMNSGGYY